MRAKEFVTEYKKYPTTEYGGVTFTMIEKDGQLIVKALNDFGIAMGYVVFNMDGKELDPKDLEVEEKYQGQGIASTMYDYIKSRGFTINRSFDQTDAGRGFWDKHRGEDSYVWETTNPDIHHNEFRHSQQIGDFVYKAEADNTSGYGTTLVITAYDGKKEIAQVEFIMDEDADSLTSANTWVLPKYQELGIATTMYAYAKMLGNDVTPSRIQTDQGNAMWRSWNQKKQSKHILPKGHKGYNEIAEDRGQGAAGIVLYAEDTGRYGLQQRSNEINDPGLWAAWGGGREPDESLEQCAKRELMEESGYTGPVELKRIGENSKYVTFLGIIPNEFEPRANPEWQDYCWVEAGDWPSPLHPGTAAALKNIPVNENFDDGKVKGKSRPGRVKRAGASCAGSVTDLRAKARKYSGERGKMYHWCANMKSGKK